MPTDLLPRLISLDRAVTRHVAYGLPHPRWFVRPLGVLSSSANHGVLWFALAAVPFALRRPRGGRRFLYVSGAVLAAEVANYGVKTLVERPRPAPEDGEETLIKSPRTSSFPSSHAAMAVAACATVRRLSPRMAGPCAILGGVLCASRPYLRVHYAGDVAVGLVVGRLVTSVYTRLVRAPIEQAGSRAVTLPGTTGSDAS
jgi:membrane-associated phospholipid phosphatase